MSQSYGDGAAGASGNGQPSGKVETAKQEAAEVAETAKGEAGHVVETARSEAGAVAQEAKAQFKDLYAQTRTELREQASVQQRRVAEGLRSVGGELRSMADNSDGSGMAADLVRQASTRVSAVAGWLGDREPEGLLREVKSYARRRPGMFIAVAALAGLAVGRLTRALSESAAEHSDSTGTGSTTTTGAGSTTTGAAGTSAGGYGTGSPAGTAAGATSAGVYGAGAGYGAAGTAAGTGAAGVAGGAGAGMGAGAATSTAGSESGEWAEPPAGAPQAPDGVAGDVAAAAREDDLSADTPVFDQTDAARQDGYGEERP